MLIASEKVLCKPDSRPDCRPKTMNVAGVPVVPFESYDQALACIERTIDTGEKAFWVAINPQKCFRAWHDQGLLEILNRADVGICDGVGVSVASRILYGQRIERCTGCDLFFKIMPVAAEKGWGVFMLGASPESNAAARENLLKRFPELRIVGNRDGYFDDSATVIDEINASGADLLFVAMGSPKQEYWISQHRDQINASFCMGVGGSFDVASGRINRAPRFFQRTGTEFLYQLVTEPHRWKRQKVYFPFMLKVIAKRLAGTGQSAQWTARPLRQS